MVFNRDLFLFCSILVPMETTSTITYEEFEKVQVRVGTIENCTKVEGSSKLFKLDVDFGELGKRTILTGMQPFYTEETFKGLQTLFVFNLAPRKMMGLESQGMLLSVGLDHTQKPILINLHNEAKNGDGVC